MKFVPLALCLIGLPAVARGEEATKSDIVYKTTGQGPLRLDLHYPEPARAGAKYPFVLFTHGGGWTTGDKNVERGLRAQAAAAIKAEGFCFASVDYRLWTRDGDVFVRDCVTDAKDALRFLAKNAARFSLDPERAFAFGDSAGGQIAQILLLSPPEAFPGDPELADTKFRLIAGVSWYGPCDFEKTDLFIPVGASSVNDRFGPRIVRPGSGQQESLAAFREVSPVNYLGPRNPPLLMIQGEKDPTIPVHHATYMKERAEAAGAPVEILIVRNAGHNWRPEGGEIDPSLEEILAKTAGFLKQHLSETPSR